MQKNSSYMRQMDKWFWRDQFSDCIWFCVCGKKRMLNTFSLFTKKG